MTSESDRLLFLARVALKEAEHLEVTTSRLFQSAKVTEQRVQEWIQDTDTAERLDAFVARYGRLQDTLGDKLIPGLLAHVGETLGPAIDNLDKAERFGWIPSVDDWLANRKLRNQMIHEYIEDPAILADALEAGRHWTKVMIQVAKQLAQETQSRVGPLT